ncbi:MAG: hypothetical protein ABH823_03760 [bacterium]
MTSCTGSEALRAGNGIFQCYNIPEKDTETVDGKTRIKKGTASAIQYMSADCNGDDNISAAELRYYHWQLLDADTQIACAQENENSPARLADAVFLPIIIEIDQSRLSPQEKADAMARVIEDLQALETKLAGQDNEAVLKTIAHAKNRAGKKLVGYYKYFLLSPNIKPTISALSSMIKTVVAADLEREVLADFFGEAIRSCSFANWQSAYPEEETDATAKKAAKALKLVLAKLPVDKLTPAQFDHLVTLNARSMIMYLPAPLQAELYPAYTALLLRTPEDVEQPFNIKRAFCTAAAEIVGQAQYLLHGNTTSQDDIQQIGKYAEMLTALAADMEKAGLADSPKMEIIREGLRLLASIPTTQDLESTKTQLREVEAQLWAK